jgi:hypothetical protein
MVKNKGNVIGAWAFLIGVLLAIVLGSFDLIGKYEWITITLVILGAIIGLINITSKESMPFLFSAAILVIVCSTGGVIIASAIPRLASVLVGLLILFVPATIVVAVKNVFGLAKD